MSIIKQIKPFNDCVNANLINSNDDLFLDIPSKRVPVNSNSKFVSYDYRADLILVGTEKDNLMVVGSDWTSTNIGIDLGAKKLSAILNGDDINAGNGNSEIGGFVFGMDTYVNDECMTVINRGFAYSDKLAISQTFVAWENSGFRNRLVNIDNSAFPEFRPTDLINIDSDIIMVGDVNGKDIYIVKVSMGDSEFWIEKKIKIRLKNIGLSKKISGLRLVDDGDDQNLVLTSDRGVEFKVKLKTVENLKHNGLLELETTKLSGLKGGGRVVDSVSCGAVKIPASCSPIRRISKMNKGVYAIAEELKNGIKDSLLEEYVEGLNKVGGSLETNGRPAFDMLKNNSVEDIIANLPFSKFDDLDSLLTIDVIGDVSKGDVSKEVKSDLPSLLKTIEDIYNESEHRKQSNDILEISSPISPGKGDVIEKANRKIRNGAKKKDSPL